MINNSYHSKFRQTQTKDFKRINYQIRVPRIFLIDEVGNKLGETDTSEGMRMAEEKDLDLVEVSPNSHPPICKIMDWGKYLYQKQREQKKPKTQDIKVIRVSFKIGVHDKEIKIKKAKDFLKEGHKVKVSMMLRGRENVFATQAIESVKEFANGLSEFGKIESQVKKMGKFIDLLIGPK